MALTSTQRTAVQSLYNKILQDMQARYGSSVKLEGVRFLPNQQGQIIDLQVLLNVTTPPDADGDTTYIDKYVSIW